MSRAPMANWMILAAERCQPLIELLIEDIRNGPLDAHVVLYQHIPRAVDNSRLRFDDL